MTPEQGPKANVRASHGDTRGKVLQMERTQAPMMGEQLQCLRNSRRPGGWHRVSCGQGRRGMR